MQNRNIVEIIKKIFSCKTEDILELKPAKKGMTNDSFIFKIDTKRYILRLPGNGTNKLINRQQEFISYQLANSHDISDNVVYMEPSSGIKVTEYIENARNCDPFSKYEVSLCMDKLKQMHKLNLQVEHKFDLLQKINYYEKLRNAKSKYKDYDTVKQSILTLIEFVDSLDKQYCLSHIDAIHDNFLLDEYDNVKIIDWEYSGMQDPHIDIAMFAVYAGYNHEQLNELINIYFENDVTEELIIKIYAYVAIVGFMWSNWCEYKAQYGFDFEEYAQSQWNYAITYAPIVLEYISKRVETAIIVAAGKGVRLGIYTTETPKPLIKVHGQPIIEKEIEALIARGIKDINIVVGYKKEQFEYLKDKYKVSLIYNPDFDKANNISSLYYARHKLINKNTVIMDGDLLFSSPLIIKQTIPYSGYSAFWTEETKEWALYLNDVNKIIACDRDGGKDCLELKSVSYWTRTDATLLSDLIAQVYKQQKRTDVYWDDVPMFIHFDKFNLFVHHIDDGDITEIDTVEELQAIDKSYK